MYESVIAFPNVEVNRGAQKESKNQEKVPVCSSLGMVGGAALIDRPESESSRPEGTMGAAGGGVTAESWT